MIIGWYFIGLIGITSFLWLLDELPSLNQIMVKDILTVCFFSSFGLFVFAGHILYFIIFLVITIQPILNTKIVDIFKRKTK